MCAIQFEACQNQLHTGYYDPRLQVSRRLLQNTLLLQCPRTNRNIVITACVKEDINVSDMLFNVAKRCEVAAMLKRNEVLKREYLALSTENAALKARFAAKQEEHERLKPQLEQVRTGWAEFLQSCDLIITRKIFRISNAYFVLTN